MYIIVKKEYTITMSTNSYNEKKIIKNKYVITTIFVIITYFLYLKMMEIYPFGENSILKSDLYKQYINFFCYLKQILINDKSILMCWNLGLANNFYTTFAYYLISPINLLVVFFNFSNIDIFVEIAIGIKIVLMANFTLLFLKCSYNYSKKESIIFGLIYAFSSYVICYSFHIMWLDCLYMLPIVLLFVDKFIDNNKILPLILSLAYAILTNYYIGYMVAFFAGIYYLTRCFIVKKKNFIKSLLKFLFAISISFIIGMIVIYPSLLQLHGKMNISKNAELIKIDKVKIRLFINVIFNNYIYSFTQKSCFMFSSTLIILLLPMYFLNSKISKREKIGYSIVIIFLVLPIVSPFLDKLWHCFTVPNCFNYRYSFTLIFIMVLIGAREFQNKRGTKKKDFLFTLIIFFLLTIIELIFKQKGYLELDGYIVSYKSILVSIVIYLTFFAIVYYLYFVNSKSKKNIVFLVLIFVIMIDLLVGANSGQNNNDRYLKRDMISQYNNFWKYFKKNIKQTEIERVVFYPDSYGSNMSLKYEYSNIGFFSSARNRDILKSMYRLGYNVQMDEQLWITSYSGTFLNYDIAGVKYFITKQKFEENEIYGFNLIEKYDNLYIYENKNNFNIGYYLSDNIEESYNPFKMQNEYINNLTSGNSDYQYFQDPEKSEILNCKKQIEKNNETQEYTINYEIEAKDDCSIYIFSDYNLQAYVNGKEQFENYSNIWSTETGIKQVKHLKKGGKATIKIVTTNSLDSLYIYASNNNKIQNILNEKDKDNYFSNVKIEKDGLTGTANFKDNGYLAFAMSYDKNWKIFVDGNKVKTENIAGCFIGTKLEKGIHKIKIVF